MTNDNEKTAWPELVDKPYTKATEIIIAERPDVYVHALAYGSIVTMDLRYDRVRVYYDPETHLVSREPRVG